MRAHGQLEKHQRLSAAPPPTPFHVSGPIPWWPLTCSLLLLFSKPGFFFFLMGLVDMSCGWWPLEEWGGLGALFWAVLSVEPGSERHTGCILMQSGLGPLGSRVEGHTHFVPKLNATLLILLEYTYPTVFIACLKEVRRSFFCIQTFLWNL